MRSPARLPRLLTTALALVSLASLAHAEHKGYLAPVQGAGEKPRFEVVATPTAYPNLVCEVATPNDPYFRYQTQLQIHDAQSAWAAQGNANGVVVAVLDTGVAYEYWSDDLGEYVMVSDLAGTAFLPGYDFVNDDEHPNDDNHHGTFIAGVVAQTTNNFRGAAGLAQGAIILPVKILGADGRGTLGDVIDGIIYAADSGADVIVMSFSFPTGEDPGQPLEAALRYAADRGCIMVGAAGNEGRPTVAYPAASPYCIAVGAVRTDATTGVVRTRYSNWGTALDVMAFGGDGADRNGDEKPDAPLAQAFYAGDPTSETFYFIGGTSSATATVGATVALLLASGATPEVALAAMLASADDLEAPGFDTQTGMGLVNPAAAILAASTNPQSPSYSTTIHLSMQITPTKVRLIAELEVLESGAPVAGVRTFVHFAGRFAAMAGDDATNVQGRARVVSDWLPLDGSDPYGWVPNVDYGIVLDRIVGTANKFDPDALAPISNEPGANIIIDVPIKER